MLETDSRNWLVTVGGMLVIGVVLLLVLAFLPPFRLLNRIQGGNYVFLTADNPTASHQDGLHIVAGPDQLDGDFGVQLESVPRLNFLEGSAGGELKRAAQSLPAHLLVKSPYYKISTRGDAPESTLIAVDIPNDAEPWETLDLYTWTGEDWRWIGAQVDANRVLIIAEVGTDVPESVVVMQAGVTPAAILVELAEGQLPAGIAASGATHLLPLGLSLGPQGSIAGDPSRLPLPSTSDGFALLPSLRNWSPENGQVNQAALADLLAYEDARQAHAESIVALVVRQGYAGIDLDYRGVTADWRDAYTDFVVNLADALHAQGKTLSVAVEPARGVSGDWGSGGYDWRALGQAVDFIRAPLPTGDVQSYMTWALAQVGRHKLLPVFETLSRDQVSDQTWFVSLEKALAPLGEITRPTGSSVAPGDKVQVDLGGDALATLRQDEGSQIYSYVYRDDQGIEHQVSFATTASLVKMLEWSTRYHLGGVYVAGILEPGSDPALQEAVRQFATQTPPATAGSLQVVWTVQAPDGGELARDDRPLQGNDSFEWTAPETAGEYTIGAAIAFRSGAQGLGRKDISISVAAPTPEPAPTPEAEPVAAAPVEANAATLPTFAANCLNAAYVADVTVVDNTRFEKGEAFEKVWRVRNSGSCPWPEGAKLIFVSGDQMNAPQSVDVGTLEVGGTTDVKVNMAAPNSDGGYRGVWRLADKDGTPFGTQLTVVIKAGEEPVVVNPGPVAPLPSGGFQLGGHYRSWSYVGQMKSAGMSWAKTQVHFNQDASGIVATAHNNDFKIQLSALGSPDMVTQPDFHAQYTAWVASLARAGANAIEVWNEPNIEREWQIGQISPEAYTQLLCASYSAIKAANPDTIVISAAPAPTGWFGGCGGNGCDDLPWLQRMYNAGAANCMDYIGAHHNSGATSPSARTGHPADDGNHHHSWYFLPQTELYYNTFGGTRKLFYTEMGYASQEGLPQFSDQFAWARGINNNQQAAWLAEAVRLSRSTGMVSNIIVWNIDFTRYGYDPQDGYAIIRPGGSCPACTALSAAVQ